MWWYQEFIIMYNNDDQWTPKQDASSHMDNDYIVTSHFHHRRGVQATTLLCMHKIIRKELVLLDFEWLLCRLLYQEYLNCNLIWWLQLQMMVHGNQQLVLG